MAGLSAIHSKLRTLNNISIAKIKGRQQSVVYMNDNREIVWPEFPNQNGGCLVVPYALTTERWAEKHGRQVG